jgi:hypothetical protein
MTMSPLTPVLARNGGGALLNVASIASWISGLLPAKALSNCQP